ncbi:MAG: 3-hydroxyacyl-CoA dehydrogenase NAD-binding domain-containing protein, partial [Bacillota bacterium]
KELLERIEYSADINCVKEADFVVEAILERIEVKHKFWAEVSKLVRDDAVLATNTSGLSITKIAEVVFRPERFAGMHWINPPHIIPLIEVIKGEKTTDECAGIVRDLALKVKKKPVIVKDAPGFVLNRIQLAILRECLFIQKRGIASIEAIDDVMKYGLGLRYACLGPFEVADLGGLDVFNNIASYLFADLSNIEESFGLLKECVEENRLGVKSGSGFYDYSNGRDEEVIKYRDQMYTKIVKCLYE